VDVLMAISSKAKSWLSTSVLSGSRRVLTGEKEDYGY
jgi:hypothetical protein